MAEARDKCPMFYSRFGSVFKKNDDEAENCQVSQSQPVIYICGEIPGTPGTIGEISLQFASLKSQVIFKSKELLPSKNKVSDPKRKTLQLPEHDAPGPDLNFLAF